MTTPNKSDLQIEIIEMFLDGKTRSEINSVLERKAVSADLAKALVDVCYELSETPTLLYSVQDQRIGQTFLSAVNEAKNAIKAGRSKDETRAYLISKGYSKRLSEILIGLGLYAFLQDLQAEKDRLYKQSYIIGGIGFISLFYSNHLNDLLIAFAGALFMFGLKRMYDAQELRPNKILHHSYQSIA
jgi:hypothetical protein